MKQYTREELEQKPYTWLMRKYNSEVNRYVELPGRANKQQLINAYLTAYHIEQSNNTSPYSNSMFVIDM